MEYDRYHRRYLGLTERFQTLFESCESSIREDDPNRLKYRRNMAMLLDLFEKVVTLAFDITAMHRNNPNLGGLDHQMMTVCNLLSPLVAKLKKLERAITSAPSR